MMPTLRRAAPVLAVAALEVTAGGTGIVSHAGVALVGRSGPWRRGRVGILRGIGGSGSARQVG